MRRNPVLLNWSLIPAGAGLLLLLTLSLIRLRDPANSGHAAPPTAPPAGTHPASAHTREFFGWPTRVEWIPLTNNGNPFFTLAIRPPLPPKPPAPPPATRKIDVTYRGYLETSSGIRRAIIQVGDKQVLARIGEPVLADYLATEIQRGHLLLTSTNPPTGTNPPASVKIDFPKTNSIEIPTQ